MSNFKDILSNSNSWPVIEAKKILENINNQIPEKGYVLFETGYGPSGLPHIGTFGEVARTTMVLNAFKQLSDIPTKLVCFSDDLDGLRKVPDNLPNPEMIKVNIGKSLTQIPDPFNEKESFGAYMNSKLCEFLDKFSFEYEFYSATKCYKSGIFDKVLLKILAKYDEIMAIMLPTLGEERRQTYSPFLPICPETGVVLQVPMESINVEKGTVTYKNSKAELVETEVVGGKCKLQWKVDWAMRWCALDVDYEMHGKDLTPSAILSAKICQALGYKSPVRYIYELFLDQEGKKISKSKGNGISIEEWLNYAPQESLSLYMYINPRKAKKLHFDVIPKNMDDYLTHISNYYEQEPEKQVMNPVAYIHNFHPPQVESNLNFSLLLTLASVCNANNKEILWGFIKRYDKNLTPENSVVLDKMVGFAVKYYNDFIKLNKEYKEPTEEDKELLKAFLAKLESMPSNVTGEEIQNGLYDLCRELKIETKFLFFSLYELLLGQKQGPRWGSFIALHGIENIIKKAKEVIDV